MQELNVQPTNPTPYTPAGGMYNFNPTPGAGGLPALSGLTRDMNPMAQQLQQQGRGNDSMLVHMTPDEVKDLQSLAMYHGTTMTVNPNTGLPEAGLLGGVFKKLLPTLIGAGLAATGVGAPLAAAMVGVGSTAMTGSLKKGLMAGLGAYGGASLAGAAGLGGSISKTGFGTLSKNAGFFGSNMGAGSGLAGISNVVAPASAAVGTPMPAAQGAFAPGFAEGVSGMQPGFAGGARGLSALGDTMAGAGGSGSVSSLATKSPGFFKSFANTARAGLPKGIAQKIAPGLAISGLTSAASGVADKVQQSKDSKKKVEDPNKDWIYEGPYRYVPQVYNPTPTGPEGRGEILFFEPRPAGQLPYVTAAGTQPKNPFNKGFAEGGSVPESAKPLDKREYMIDYAGDADAYRLMSQGITDASGQRQQFSGVLVPGQKAGSIQDFGGKRLMLGEDLRWRVTGDTPIAPPPPPPTAPPPPPTTTRLTLDDVLPPPPPPTTTPPPPPTTTPPPGTPTPPPGTPGTSKPSGTGLEVLADTYTPSFTEKERVTYQAPARTDGTQALARLPGLVNMFSTSPGAITASTGYSGGSPSERNRAYFAELAKRRQAELAAEAARRAAIATADTANPYGYTGYTGFARGGGIHMDNGSFVVDARTVSELGNGSSSAGQELLARLGGRPVKGPGDGVSDSIRANIGGRQRARVARDEVIFPAKAVKRLGGAKKLYALMAKAEKARKKAKRGQDTGLRRGLV